MSTPDQRHRMAKAIVDFEARRDSAGHLEVYHLPANDGGGRYEVAGINERFDKPIADKLVALIEAGKFDEAEQVAIEYIASNTDSAAKLTVIPSIESYLRDTCFNRGARGAIRILQRALKVDDDGEVGPITEKRRDAAEKTPQILLTDLRAAREDYERNVVGYRANLWAGLVNRWDGALKVARTFPDVANAPVPAPQGAPSAGKALVDLILAILRAIAGLFRKPAPVPPPAKPAPAGATSQPPWVTWALKEVGFHEKPNNTGIERYTSLAHCGGEGDPWCAIFANAGLEASGIRGTRSAMARSFEHDPSFVRLPGPAYGAITTMWRGSPAGGQGHVFYYLGENDHGILALGGNQSDQVRKQYEPRARIVGYFWPKSLPAPKTGAIAVNDATVDVGGSEA